MCLSKKIIVFNTKNYFLLFNNICNKIYSQNENKTVKKKYVSENLKLN